MSYEYKYKTKIAKLISTFYAIIASNLKFIDDYLIVNKAPPSGLKYCYELWLTIAERMSGIKLKLSFNSRKWAEKLKLSFQEFDNIFKKSKIPSELQTCRKSLDDKINQIINDLKPPRQIVSLINSKKLNSKEYQEDKINLNIHYTSVSETLQETLQQKLNEITKT